MRRLFLLVFLALLLPIQASSANSFIMMAGSGGAVTTTDFVTVWRTTADEETITLPTRSGFTYNAVVDWGDSSSSEITAYNDADITHAYAVAGNYTVRISGVFQAFFFNNGGDKLKLIEVQNLGVVGWTGAGLTYAFYGCTNLVSFIGGNTDTSAITALIRTWYNCTNLAIADVSSLDVAAVSNLLSTFTSCASLTTLDLSTWNVSNVTGMSELFQGCLSLSSIGDISGWNTEKVIGLTRTFFLCDSLNIDISTFNIGAVTEATNMMQGSAFGNANYDKMLVAWAAQEPNIRNSVPFHAGTAKYTEAAARAVLATTHSWVITDGGAL